MAFSEGCLKDADSKTTVANSNASLVAVRLRQKPKALAPKNTVPPPEADADQRPSIAASVPNGNTVSVIQRALGSLYEASADVEDNTEEIRKLDSQLDHLNEYMDKVEERLNNHSVKLLETIQQQKQEREKRRRSFHERLDANRQEDDDFQRQLTQVLSRVDSLKRQSVHDIGSLSLQPATSPSTDTALNGANKVP